MLVTSTVYDGTGRIMEQTVDHGDGTGTVTDYTTDPPTVTTIDLPVPDPAPPDPMAVLAALDPAQLAQVVALGAALVARSDTLAEQVAAVSKSSTSRAPLATIADAVTEATTGGAP